ncbi:hypothetical protein [Marivirga sp.]|uniref:hypothetical protein n=1 Tax=Marivirga sp. TaxID=2018662 RepID=UPI002D80F4BF|nr:hypothetical protein [Marivirga sp.]HET8858330.1 hypothetical protein [Marivirga sp.]
MKDIYLSFSLFFLIISCQSNLPDDNIKGVIYQLADSVIIKEGDLRYVDQNESKVLFYNTGSFSIYTYDRESDTLYAFNKFGNGPENYNLIYNNISLYKEHLIMVGQINKVLIFDILGNFIEAIPITDQRTRSPLLTPKEVSDYIYFINSPQGNFSNPDFYKNNYKVLLKYSLNKKDVTEFGHFPSSIGDYQNGKHFYLYSGLFFLEIDEEFVYLMSKNEGILQKYTHEGQLVNEFDLSLERFKPYPINFSKQLNEEEMDFVTYQNSTIQNISVVEDLIFVCYSDPYSLDELQRFKSDHPDFHGFDKPPLKYVLAIFDKSGERIHKDTIVPEKFGKFLYSRNSSLFFQKQNFEGEEDVTILYQVKIKEEE